MYDTIFQSTQWQQLKTTYQLTAHQEQILAAYLLLLYQTNQQFNLTAITDISTMITEHLYDACAIKPYITQYSPRALADIGTGAGLPGMPLAILFPNITIYLIEVVEKKITFLTNVVADLALQNVQICPLDWRTFLRTTSYSIDLFCARASLQPIELIRMFRPGCPYADAQLVYWASATWQIQQKELPFFDKEIFYRVGNKKRRLIFFKKSL